MPITQDGDWEPIELDLPAEAFEGSPSANMVLLYLSVDPPRATGEATLDVDDLAFVEWREASRMPAWFAALDHVRNTGAAPVSLTVSGLPARR